MVIDDAAGELYVADGYLQPAHHRVRRQDRRLQAALGRLRQDAERREDAAVQAGRAALAAIRQSGALRAAVQRRARLCLRSRQRPHPGLPQGRHLREGVPRRAADARQRLGVGPGAVERSPAALHLHRRRRQQSGHRACARDRRTCCRNSASPDAWPGKFKWVHNVAIDSKGNLYTAEVGWGRRMQKFNRLN